ncbi:DUF1707 domain-containing protein [Micromonospora sp. NPDC005172]|uniref:DUF1707 SHOCT-like domain-containing protein n=1 Tax=Micromonospora sp. NPDC005172 TaxID=3156867 RepID=UPI0033B2611F
MRAADADRETVAERLRVALNEGRLDLHEYDERLQRAFAARTYGELDALLTDLPPVMPKQRSALEAVPAAGVPVGSPDEPAAGVVRRVTARWLAEVWLPYLRVIAVVVTVWAVTSLLSGELLYFWPVWVAGPWGAVLAIRTVAGLTRGEPRREAIERERRRQRKRAKRERRRELRPTDPDEPHDPPRTPRTP